MLYASNDFLNLILDRALECIDNNFNNQGVKFFFSAFSCFGILDSITILNRYGITLMTIDNYIINPPSNAFSKRMITDIYNIVSTEISNRKNNGSI